MTRSLLPVVVASLLGLAGSALAGDPTYSYLDLGTLGGAHSSALGLNDARQVVGWSEIPGCVTPNGFVCRRAFLWEDGVMTDLGTLPGDEESQARAINASGLIVGTSEADVIFGFGTYHSVTWNGGAPVALPDLGDGQSFAQDVNDFGLIAGHARDPGVGADRAVTWFLGVQNVGATEPHTYNRAIGVNEAGALVGFAWNLFQPNDAILGSGGTWATIGGLDGPHQNAEARDLNDTGLAVGLQAFPSGAWHPTIWDLVTQKATDLGTLPGFPLGELFDVNDAGLAVGRVYDDAGSFISRAVFFDGSALRDLNELLPAGTNAVLWDAQEVNENGDIVGTALVGGELHAFLLTLEPGDDPWTDLGNGLAGVVGVPVMAGSGSLVGGTQASITVTNGKPTATMGLFVGASQLLVPFKGGVMVPSPDGLLGPMQLSGTGAYTLPVSWPLGVPSGVSFVLQGWILDPAGVKGLSATNGLMGMTP